MKLVLLYQGRASGLETVWLNLSGVSAKPGVGAGEGLRGDQQRLLFVQSEDRRKMGLSPCSVSAGQVLSVDRQEI